MRIIWAFALYSTTFFQTFVNAAILPQTGDKCTSVCTTPACAKEAEFFTKYMDTTVDPCTDFFQFACGNYLKTVPIPEDKAYITHFDTIEDKIRDQLMNELKAPVQSSDLKAFKNVKTHYQNCLDETAIETIGVTPLLELLEKLGGWPVLRGDQWNEENYKWEDSVSDISKQGFQPGFPVKLGVTHNSTNTSNYILEVNHAETTVDENYFVSESKSLEGYKTLLIETAVLLGANRERATSELSDAFNFEVELYKTKLTQPTLMELSPIENRKSVKTLSDKHPDIPWLDILNKILNPSGISIKEDELLDVADPQFVSKIGELIGKTSKRVLANYQIWRVIFEIIDYLPQSFRKLKFNFNQATLGLQKEPIRDKVCLDLLKNTFQTAIGSMYVRDYFNKESKDSANKILKYMREELEPTLNNISWMDGETRKNAIEKLQAMKSGIGYPNELTDDQKIENYYQHLEINSGNFFEDYRKISTHSKNVLLNTLRKPVSEADWTFETEVAIANAFYNPGVNKILIVAGMLQEPFFKFERPDYLNFGGIGYVMGHEIIHGFDSLGRKYDKDGNYKNWWDDNTANEFEDRVKCLINLYNGYTVEQIDQKMDGNRTKGENIADAGGIKLAYHAYQNFVNSEEKTEGCLPNLNYSPQQMFWISAGSIWCSKVTDEIMRFLVIDTHSPPEARANVAFSNIQEFSDDFKCPVGSKMNPADKCVVW